MPAVYISPSGSTSYPVLQVGTHADQIGVNAPPSSAPGVNFDNQTGLSSFYVQGAADNTSAFCVYKHITQTQRDYSGSDTIRLGQTSAMVMTDCDMNDASIVPTQLVSRGLGVHARYGQNGPTYGLGLGYASYQTVVNSGSASNEFAMLHGYIMVGTASVPTNARNWGVGDWGVYEPVGLRPEIFGGASLVIKNLYNGSPVYGQSCGSR